MKKYLEFNELDRSQTMQRQLDELRLFQFLLRNNARLNDLYHNKAIEIANGLQPWIDALEVTMKSKDLG